MSVARRRGLLRGLLLVASIAIAFAAVEGVLTLRYRAELGPGSWVAAAGVGSAYVHHPRPNRGEVNNLALRRSDDISLARVDGVPRLLSYGDSVAHGFGISASETYANRLEVRLREQLGTPVEVLNMFRGHSPTLHGFHIRRDVPRLSPDAVLLEIELLNDVSDEAFVVTSGSDPYGLPQQIVAARYLVGFDGHLLSPGSPGSSWWVRSMLYAKLNHWLGSQRSKWSENPIFAADADTAYYARRSERHLLTAEALDRGFDRMFESIAGIHRYLDARGVGFRLVIMPSRDSFESGPKAQGALRLLRRAEARAAELELPAVSLHAPLGAAGGAALYMDFCHPTAVGNEAIAGALFETVLELLGPRS